MAKIYAAATSALATRSRYSIGVKIGIAQYTFTVRQFGRHGFTLHKNDDIINEYPDLGSILTALACEIEMYI